MGEVVGLRARFDEASAIVASVRDIVVERADVHAPTWCRARGWETFLEGLEGDAVAQAEREGLAAYVATRREAPASLVTMAAAVARVVALPNACASDVHARATRRASPRKSAQVEAFARLAAPLVNVRGARRIVDVGSGHGHLTRELAAAFGGEVVGWERDPARVAVANALTPAGGPTFHAVDVRDAHVHLAAGDVVVGLHACGGLGDLVVTAAGEAGASVVLVGCCLQKREGDRVPLTPGVSERDALVLPHAALGLGNVRDGGDGVEAPLETRVAARVSRRALRLLFDDAGVAMAPGEEMRGVNRRRATGELADLARHAFAVRGLAAPSLGSIDAAHARARVEHERVRRFELPRTMLARLIEVWVALDRAASLEARGYVAKVVTAFDGRESPRNIAVIGRAGSSYSG